ncbi:MAG: hypothetical protein E6Q25_04505 [Acinetobacter sp.]|jgi:hypothetical protein|nr:MAG: hypothetical protein E6Q25_04505 [Acinetobacter sp.]
MKKLLILSSVFCCTLVYANAAPKGVTPEFWQQKQSISAVQSAAYSKIDALNEIRLARTLTDVETANYNKYVCEAVAAETQFAKLMKSDLAQAKIVLEDASVDAAAIQDMMESSENYEAAQELKGTAAECKS